jgi:hypothetical protein
MTGDSSMFNSINTSGNSGYDSITFGDNRKGKVKGLGKIAISNDMSISNVLLVENLISIYCRLHNFVILASSAYLGLMI